MAIDILVVEDEYTERQELTQLLETVTPPEHIRSAATCSAAIAAISQLCPDLILLDIMLRGSSGFEVAEFVRSNRLDCKIIILTAYHEFDFASKALSMDLQDYLLKPVRPSVLLQRVRDVLHLSSPASAATGLAVWPYLACGISSPLPADPQPAAQHDGGGYPAGRDRPGGHIADQSGPPRHRLDGAGRPAGHRLLPHGAAAVAGGGGGAAGGGMAAATGGSRRRGDRRSVGAGTGGELPHGLPGSGLPHFPSGGNAGVPGYGL